MLFANRHINTLIINNNDYPTIKLGASVSGIHIMSPSSGTTTLTAGSKPSSVSILSYNMMYNCHTATSTKQCYNNMIDYVNAANPFIFCAQEATWFFPARPHNSPYSYAGYTIKDKL